MTLSIPDHPLLGNPGKFWTAFPLYHGARNLFSMHGSYPCTRLMTPTTFPRRVVSSRCAAFPLP